MLGSNIDIEESIKQALRRAEAMEKKLRALYWVASRERRESYRTDIPIRKRLWAWKNGFVSFSTVLYDFETYDKDDFLNDYQFYHHMKANGEERIIADHKYPLDRILRHENSDILTEIYGVIREGRVLDPPKDVLAESTGDWIRENLSESEVIVIKPEDGTRGADVHVIKNVGDGYLVDGSLASLEEINQLTINNTYIITEFIEQADYAATIYPRSVNTIRLLTLWDYETDEPFVADAIHRFGVDATQPVDNWGQGGLSTAINLETGELGASTRNPDKPKLEWYDIHPDTRAQIKGVQIPRWDAVKESTLEMASELWYMPMAGWDITITKDGYKVIEANSSPGLNTLQVHQPLLRDDRTRRFFERHDVI